VGILDRPRRSCGKVEVSIVNRHSIHRGVLQEVRDEVPPAESAPIDEAGRDEHQCGNVQLLQNREGMRVDVSVRVVEGNRGSSNRCVAAVPDDRQKVLLPEDPHSASQPVDLAPELRHRRPDRPGARGRRGRRMRP